MRGFNFINPANNRTSNSDHEDLYRMLDELGSRVRSRRLLEKYQPLPKPFYIGGTDQNVRNVASKLENLKNALLEYDDLNLMIFVKT
jgi:hypothetical protein